MIKQILTLYFLGLSKKTISYIIRKFSEEEKELLWKGNALELQFIHNIFENKELSIFLDGSDFSIALHKAEEQIDYCNTNNIKIISIFDDTFPNTLLKVENPPLFIFAKGNIELINSSYNIACVGTRKPSPDAKNNVKNFVKGLVSNNFIIVSGLAYGIDAESHKVCIDNKGKTIAVLANGLDNIYPRQHFQLAEEIIENEGLLISEYPIYSTAQKSNFVQRNRIITGISEGVIVFEASENSGTMHSARFAYKQKKKIFCPIDNKEGISSGVNQLLLTNSALPVKNYKDIVLNFKLDNDVNNYQEPFHILQKAMSQIQLNNEKKHIEESNNKTIITRALELNEEAYTTVQKYAEENNITIQEVINNLLIAFSETIQKGKKNE